MVVHPLAARRQLGRREGGIQFGIKIKAHRRRLPLDSIEMIFIAESLAGWQANNSSQIAGRLHGTWTMQRAMIRRRLLADSFHHVDLAALGPTHRADVFA